MKFSVPHAALIAALCVPLLASASPGTDNTAAIKQTFVSKFPAREVMSVTATPVSGIYEVVLQGRQIVYTDAKVQYLFVGDMVNVATKRSLTEARVAQLSQVDWKSLPLDLAIKEVRGDGSRKLAVFTDPDCPYCKRLEKEGLKGVTNVTIYTFLFPITQLHPDALTRSRKIWCSSDRLGAWRDLMLNGRQPSAAATCTNPIDKVMQLGTKLGITATPTLIFGNGQLQPGAPAKDELEKMLSANQ